MSLDREELANLLGEQVAWTAVVLVVALALWRTGLSTCSAACGVWSIFTFVGCFPSREAEALHGVVDAMDLQPRQPPEVPTPQGSPKGSESSSHIQDACSTEIPSR
jgi:hypothetical protein